MKRLILAEKGELPPDVPNVPPPLNYELEYVMGTWLTYHRYGRYPEAGGYNDQCPLLMEDFTSMTLWHIRVENGATAIPLAPQGADHWQSMMEG